MSESGKAGVQYVYQRWQDCKKELWKQGNRQGPHSGDIYKYMKPVNPKGWISRYNRQVRAIHFAAFKLEPANRDAAFTGREKEILREWLKSQDQGSMLYEQYLDYSTGEGIFGEMDPASTTKIYWQEKVRSTSTLRLH